MVVERIATVTARQPIGLLEPELRAGTDADAMPHQHRWCTTGAACVGAQEGGRGVLVVTVITTLARRRAPLVRLSLGRTAMLAGLTGPEDAAAAAQ